MNFRFLTRVAVFLAAALSLAGCTHYASLPPGNVDVHGRIIVTVDRQWSRQVVGQIWGETWTVNGTLLDALQIADGIPDGRPLVELPAEAAKNLPRFRAGMGAEDIVQLLQATLSQTIKANDFALVAIDATRIAGNDGIRFEFTFGTGTGGEGIETDRRAIGVAFESDKRLFLILFHAAELHYFGSLRGAAEATIASVRFPQKRV